MCAAQPHYDHMAKKIAETFAPAPAAAQSDENVRITVILTPEQHEQIRTAAARDGLAVSTWLRSVGLRQARGATSAS